MQIKTKYWTMENKEMTNIIIEGINTIFNKFLVNKGFNPEEMTYCDQTLFLEDRIEIEPYLFIRGVQWFGGDRIATWTENTSGDVLNHYFIDMHGEVEKIDSLPRFKSKLDS